MLLVLAMAMAGCGTERQALPPQPSQEEVVAEIDGRPLRVGEVVEHLSPPDPAVDIGAPVNPRRQALDDAIRVKLFAGEAARRGPRAAEGPSQVTEARRVQSFIRSELARRDAGFDASESEVRRYYDEHRGLFNADKLRSVSLETVVVDDPESAERILAQAESASDEGFAKLVAEHSLDEASRKRGGRLAMLVEGEEDPFFKGGAELGREVSSVGWSLRGPGQVGLARASDGRYHVLRADEVDMDFKPLDRKLAAYVAGVVAMERREQTLRETERRLRESADITVDETVLYRIRVPDW